MKTLLFLFLTNVYSIQYQESSIQYPVSKIQYQESSIQYQESSIRYLLYILSGTLNINTVKPYGSKSNLNIIEAYLQAKQKSLQEDAAREDIEKTLDFYSDTLYYEHVLSSEKKFIFHGKNDLRNGYIAHLGETRNVKIILLNSIERQNIVVAEYSVKREIISTGKTENNEIVSFFEFDKNGKIKRMIDYL